MSDDELLEAYVRERSEAAFEGIVREYGGMVYASARRQVGDAHLAEDVVQGVFLLLARKAAGLGGGGRVAGWLMKTTHFVSREAIRQKARQARRERKAAEMAPKFIAPVEGEATTLEGVGAALDGALARLREGDRDVVVMRYLRGKSLAEVAAAAGTSQDAARKRIERALAKLRSHLARDGVYAQVGALPAIVAAAGGAPAGRDLVAAVVRAASVDRGAARALAQLATERVARLKLAVTTACVAAVAGGVVWYGWGARETVVYHQPAVAVATRPGTMKGREYQADFGGTVGNEWSFRQTTVAPSGGPRFLGEMTDQPVTLALTRMPAHTHLRVTFDLLTMMSWDGSGIHTGAGALVGPDSWDMRVAGGPMLVWQTFSNHPDDPVFADELKFQSYPSPVPGDKWPTQTGAAERQTLGYAYDVFPMDAVYHMNVVFPHSGPDVRLQFWGIGRGKSHAQANGKNDASWGLRGLKVEAVAAGDVRELDEAGARAALERAVGPDPVDADRAFWELAVGGRAVRSVMQEALAGVPAVDHQRARALIEAATRTTRKSPEATAVEEAFMAEVGALGEADLWDALRRDGSPAYRKKVEPVVRALVRGEVKEPALRRAAVAGRVLEVIGRK